ncbi:hypothetical protein [Stenotrophomonas sp. CC22-02]|uniref:hypothetical protein n=1 Tax=Stenotrophomonas sp. CC22-02 TaxID=1378087 RepID=UPI001FB97A8C|nr:hypothetical protein [Stenotrophomonas sp. CC22-02]
MGGRTGERLADLGLKPEAGGCHLRDVMRVVAFEFFWKGDAIGRCRVIGVDFELCPLWPARMPRRSSIPMMRLNDAMIGSGTRVWTARYL